MVPFQVTFVHFRGDMVSVQTSTENSEIPNIFNYFYYIHPFSSVSFRRGKMGKVFLFQTVNRVTVTPLFRTKKCHSVRCQVVSAYYLKLVLRRMARRMNFCGWCGWCAWRSVEVIYVCSWQIWLEFCQKFGTSIRKYGTCWTSISYVFLYLF